MKAHQDLSRQGAEKKFKGGLGDHSWISTRYHTATHLLHKALRDVLGTHVEQRGSNITAERMRFDFSQPQKMTAEQIKKVEDLVNEAIARDFPVHYEEMTVDEAKARGAIGLFEDRYGDKIKVWPGRHTESRGIRCCWTEAVTISVGVGCCRQERPSVLKRQPTIHIR